MDFITGLEDGIKGLQSIGTVIKDFFSSISLTMYYLPTEFWALIIAALVLVILLRVLGR